MKRLGLAAWAVAVLASVSIEAHAQSRRYPLVPKDADEDKEQRSGLWERVLHPHRDRYEERVKQARALLDKRDDQADSQALAMLENAIELAPGEPDAYWLVGMVHERRDRWTQCAAAYGKVFELAPDYKPTLVMGERRAEWALDLGLGLCLAQLGAYERAITHFKRILSRGIEEPVVYRYLGQTYMALGRIDEATDALSTALRHPSSSLRSSYVLAVAYDRHEQLDEARRHLRAARRQDRDLAYLNDPREELIPTDDLLYYLGLVHEDDGAGAWAMAYFRHYLHVAGTGPWAHRARYHIDMLRGQAAPGTGIEIESTGPLDQARVAEAVKRAAADLEACVRAVPGALFQVRMTAVAGARPVRGRAPASPAPAADRGVKAQVLYSFATAPEPMAEAQRCLESVAERIALPQPGGQGSRYASITFPVIAR